MSHVISVILSGFPLCFMKNSLNSSIVAAFFPSAMYITLDVSKSINTVIYSCPFLDVSSNPIFVTFENSKFSTYSSA